MVKAVIGGKVILGLSDENVKRLKDDQPIMFNLKELGLSDTDVIIMNGKTEESIKETLLKATK